MAADFRPIDYRPDRPFRNLSDVHRAGKDGLAAIFPIGSVWEVGPFVEDALPLVVRVTGLPFTSGVNYSRQPEDRAALHEPTWFIPTENVWSPYKRNRAEGGQPPHVLAALTPRMAAISGVACCDHACYVPPCQHRMLSCNAGVVQSLRAENESLRQTIQEQDDEISRYEQKLAAINRMTGGK